MPLDPTQHDRDAFSCGNPQVDHFLKVTAGQAARYLRSSTFVLLRTDVPHQIFGFYTLAQHGYRDGELDEPTARAMKVHGLYAIPMILLAQLGIATDFQGRGLGAYLLKNALERSLSVAQEIGGVAIITDPFDADAQSFYAKYGFEVSHEQPFVRMILPLRTLARAAVAAKTKSSPRS